MEGDGVKVSCPEYREHVVGVGVGEGVGLGGDGDGLVGDEYVVHKCNKCDGVGA